MYGYESSLDYMPATEGKVGDFFSGILAKIKKAGEFIRNCLTDLGAKIKHAFKNATDAAYATTHASKVVNDLGKNIRELLDDCCASIVTLKDEYAKVGTSDEGGNFDYDAHKGMGKLSKDADKAAVKNWKEQTNGSFDKSKVTLARTFQGYAKTANKIRADLKSINASKLNVDALKAGYKQLKDIFVTNQEFGTKWKTIVMAHDWATGKIRSYLGKVVKMYQTGINAVNTYGKLLTKKNVSSIKDYDSDIDGNTVEIGSTDVKSDNKAMNAKEIRNANSGNESASRIIDRLYQMAYEDARADLEEEQELLAIYDSIPEFDFE